MCNPITTAYPGALLEKGVHEGYEWEVTCNRGGYRCGYVRVPAGHPWHGKDYEEIPAEVHGFLTFAEPDAHCGKGGEDDAWWIGFDCGHSFDAPDPELEGYDQIVADLHRRMGAVMRDAAYVRDQCISLASQAARAG